MRESPKGKYYKYKTNAKKRKLKWNLDFKDFINFWQKPCMYCGKEIKFIGLDRLNAQKYWREIVGEPNSDPLDAIKC